MNEFFEQTGYHKNFLVETVFDLIDRKYDSTDPTACEIKYNALWDSTINEKILNHLSTVSPNLHLLLLSNLFKIQSPRLFEITAGILSNIIGSGYFKITTDSIENGLIDQFENLLNLEVSQPETLFQIIRAVHIFINRVVSGFDRSKILDRLFYLLQAATDEALLIEIVNILFTLQTYGAPENPKILYPVEPFLEGLKEISPSKLLSFDTPLLIFEDEPKVELIALYKAAYIKEREFSETTELIKSKL